MANFGTIVKDELQEAINTQFSEIRKRTRAIFCINKSINEVYTRNKFVKGQEDYEHLKNLKQHRDANVVLLNDAKSLHAKLLNDKLMTCPKSVILPKISETARIETEKALVERQKIKAELKIKLNEMEHIRSQSEFKLFLKFLSDKMGREDYLKIMYEFNESIESERTAFDNEKKRISESMMSLV